MTDADRVHCFVMEVLFQRQVVLLYRPHNRPGGLSLVLASPWSLERGKTDGRHFVTFDAKHDTQESGQLRWSSFRCTSGEDHGHVGVPISVQVADRENEETIKEFALATRGGIACSDPACAHGWGAPAEASDGTWRRGRVCCRSLPLYAGAFPLVPAGGRDPALFGAPGPQAEPAVPASVRAVGDQHAVWLKSMSAYWSWTFASASRRLSASRRARFAGRSVPLIVRHACSAPTTSANVPGTRDPLH